MLAPILLTLFLADDSERPYRTSFQDVEIEVVAVQDPDGNIWRPDGGEVDDDLAKWSPAPHWASSRNESSQKRMFLIRTHGPNIEDCSFRFRMNGVSQIATSGSAMQAPSGRYFELSCVFREPLDTTTLEVDIGTGGWDDIGDVPFGRNYGAGGNFRDGGRHAEYSIRASAGDSGGSGRIAAAALSISGMESFQDEYRFVAVDEKSKVIAEPTISSGRSRLSLYVVEVPDTADPDPVKFVLQQRPRVPVAIEDIPLSKPDK